jgi:hypothetical protein
VTSDSLDKSSSSDKKLKRSVSFVLVEVREYDEQLVTIRLVDQGLP